MSNDTVILQIKVESNDTEECGTISIHSLDCQTNECFKTRIVYWQTMLELGVLTITANDYYTKGQKSGFFIKFTTHSGNNFRSNFKCD